MKTKNFIRSVAFLLLTILLLGVVSRMMVSTNYYSTINVIGMYREPKDSLDMVMIGASEVYSGYIPTKAYEEYGYTSYSMGSMALGGNMYKTLVKEIWERQHPQVLCIEINGFNNGDSYLDREGMIRTITDNMPRNANWRETIQKVIRKEDRASYYFPLLTYHNKWNTPKEMVANTFIRTMMFMHGATKVKGFGTFSHASPYEAEDTRPDGGLDVRTREYLVDLLEYCNEIGVEHVLFFRAPHVERMIHQERLEEIGDLVKSYGYDWLNCDGVAEGVNLDLQTDFYNENHMNINGAEKWTHYLGGYLTEHYDMKTDHSAKVEEQWQESVKASNELYEQIRSDMAEGIIRRYSESALYITPPKADCPAAIGGDAHCRQDCPGKNHVCTKEQQETIAIRDDSSMADHSDVSQ